MDKHDWLDVAGWLVLLAVTLAGGLLANRLAQHQKTEDKVNDHETRIGKLETALEWLQRTFRPER